MDLLSLLRAGMSNMHVGLLQFSQVHKTEILLELDNYPLGTQMKLVDKMKYQSGRKTMTGDALTRVRNSVSLGSFFVSCFFTQ